MNMCLWETSVNMCDSQKMYLKKKNTAVITNLSEALIVDLVVLDVLIRTFCGHFYSFLNVSLRWNMRKIWSWHFCTNVCTCHSFCITNNNQFSYLRCGWVNLNGWGLPLLIIHSAKEATQDPLERLPHLFVPEGIDDGIDQRVALGYD